MRSRKAVMDNNDEAEGCSSISLRKNQDSSLGNTTGTLKPKYAGLKGFKKFQQEMARRKATNISRELPTTATTASNSNSSNTTSGNFVTFNDVPTLLVGNSGQEEANSSDSSSVYKKANGDISFHEGPSSQRKFGPSASTTVSATTTIAPTSSAIITQSKILERASTSRFINIDEESGESEEYECRCHLQQPADQEDQNREGGTFISSRLDNGQQPKYHSSNAPIQKNVHYSIDMEKNGIHLPTDASSSQSEEHAHHLSVTFDVISHPPPPSSPLSPNIVANAICPPPPMTNEPAVGDNSASAQLKYHSVTGASSSVVHEVSDQKLLSFSISLSLQYSLGLYVLFLYSFFYIK